MPAYSGFWNGIYSLDYTLTDRKVGIERVISRVMRKPGARRLRTLMVALNGAAAGGSANATVRRISHSTAEYGLGGVRTVGTVSVINRNTTSADETDIDTTLIGVFAPATYPSSRDGRRAGGMAGKF